MAKDQVNVSLDHEIHEVLKRLKEITGVNQSRLVSDMAVRMGTAYSGMDPELERLMRLVPAHLMKNEKV